MNFKLILSAVTFITLGLDILSVPFRSKKIKSKTGRLIMPLKNRRNPYFLFLYGFSFALPAVIIIRNFSLLYNVMFCIVAVLACEMISKDFIMAGKYGVYENCIAVNGVTIFYDDIVTFPILNLPEDEQEKYDHANLVVSTKSKGNENLIFNDTDECTKATELIRKMSGK